MKLKALAVALLIMTPLCASALEFGFNQAWLNQQYEEQWQNFDRDEAIRILDLTKEANATKLRMWLFPGYKAGGIVWGGHNNKTPMGVTEEFETNIIDFILLAKERGIKLNFTIFSGGINVDYDRIYREFPKSEADNMIYRMSDIFNMRFEQQIAFQNNVLKPLLDILNDPELNGVVSEIDIMNEFNWLLLEERGALFSGGSSSERRQTANNFICSMSDYIKQNSTGTIPQITASVAGLDAKMMYKKNTPNINCVDYLTVHNYDNGGEIPHCSDLVNYANQHGKYVSLGEFGQHSDEVNDSLQSSTLEKFINSARSSSCQVKTLLAWRLSDIRPDGTNKHSFEYEPGQPRPAFYDFQYFAGLYGEAPPEEEEEEDPVVDPEFTVDAMGIAGRSRNVLWVRGQNLHEDIRVSIQSECAPKKKYKSVGINVIRNSKRFGNRSIAIIPLSEIWGNIYSQRAGLFTVTLYDADQTYSKTLGRGCEARIRPPGFYPFKRGNIQ